MLRHFLPWIAFAVAMPAFAQVSGRMTGSVSDPAGAAVGHASVALTLSGSSARVAETVTTGFGLFAFTGIRPDTYNLKVEAPGFAPYTMEGLKVDTARETAVPPIRLEIASVAVSVDVTASPSVETGNAEVSSTITHDQLQRLPNRGRNPMQFMNTQAGVAANGSVNGQRMSYTNYTLDGISIDDDYFRGSTLSSLSGYLLLDQVGEITVSTSNMNAALSGASHVSLTTPSGTNQYHGSGYWSNQNSAFASNTWINNSRGASAVPPLNQNQAGVTVGGPVLRNKLFFLANYEVLRRRQHFFPNRTILTDDARTGIFTYQDTQGSLRKTNILQIAGVAIDPYVQKLLDRVPSGIDNFFAGDSRLGLLKNTGGHFTLVGVNNSLDTATGKLDYVLSPKHTFSASYLRNHVYQENPGNAGYSAVPALTLDSAYQLAALAWRWNPATRFTNQARGGISISPGAQRNRDESGAFFLDLPLFSSPINTAPSSGRRTTSAHYSDDAGYSRGRHALQFGFETQQVRTFSFSDFNVIPHYGIGIGTGNPGLTSAQLPGIAQGDLNTANALLAILAGYVTSYNESFNVTSRTSGFVAGAPYHRNFTENNFALYFQDNWKILRRLSLTLGMRYDYQGVAGERDSLALMPVVQNNNPLATLRSNATLDFAGSSAGRPWYRPDRNNFGPSIGIAWDVFGNGRTSFRAGYGIYYVNDQNLLAADALTSTWNDGLSATSSRTGLAGRVSAGLPPVTVPSFQVPRFAAGNLLTNANASLGLIDPNLRTPYVQQWTAGIEQAVKGVTLEIRYSGNHAVKEWRAIDFNQVNIRDNGFLDDFLRAYSNGYLALAATGTFNPVYNSAIAGSQALTVFPKLPNGGSLTQATNLSLIQTGQPGQLGFLYQAQGRNGNVVFLPNSNAVFTYLLTNAASSSYHALTLEARRRVGRILQFQANYNYGKAFTNASDIANRVDPPLDINNGKLEKARAATDIRHSIRGNAILDLPLGDGHRLNYRPLRRLLSGWSASGILTRQSGLPFSILSTRGTLNRASGYNTADTLLTGSQLNGIFQFRQTPSGPYYVTASVIGADGRAVASDGRSPFSGQVFFEPAPGTVGTLQRRMLSGPWTFTLDASVMKLAHITERQAIELRMDAFNALNHPTWGIADQTVDSPNFGRLGAGVQQRVIQLGLSYRF